MSLIVIRLLIGVILPLTLGSEILSVMAMVSEAKGHITLGMLAAMFFGGMIIFPFALIMMGIQSLLYSLLMEFLINPCIENKFVVYLVSIILGTVSGCTLSCEHLALVGALVGLMSGYILKSIYTFDPNPDG